MMPFPALAVEIESGEGQGRPNTDRRFVREVNPDVGADKLGAGES
jgi:hypothetical protein